MSFRLQSKTLFSYSFGMGYFRNHEFRGRSERVLGMSKARKYGDFDTTAALDVRKADPKDRNLAGRPQIAQGRPEIAMPSPIFRQIRCVLP